MRKRTENEATYVKEVYSKIIYLAIFSHASFILIFFGLSVPPLIIYNFFSVLFYLLMLYVVHKEQFRFAVGAIHLEVCLFAIVGTLVLGWDVGLWMYLVSMMSLTYFCPYVHRIIPYLYSLLEIIIFLILKIYESSIVPMAQLSDQITLMLFIYDALASFFIILYASYTSKVSAVVGKTALIQENDQLSTLANYDELTGLLNRRALLHYLEEDHRAFTVVMGDIDDFKKINDTWGHACGDYVLVSLAKLLNEQFGKQVQICRWGGEEFVLLFVEQSIIEVAEQMQEFCVKVADTKFRFENHEFHITLTFGISSEEEHLTREELIAIADHRMYEGKMQGKNQVISSLTDEVS